MFDIKISALPSAAVVNPADIVVLNQDGTTKTAAQSLIVAGLATTDQLSGLASTSQLSGFATTEQIVGIAVTSQLSGFATTDQISGFTNSAQVQSLTLQWRGAWLWRQLRIKPKLTLVDFLLARQLQQA